MRESARARERGGGGKNGSEEEGEVGEIGVEGVDVEEGGVERRRWIRRLALPFPGPRTCDTPGGTLTTNSKGSSTTREWLQTWHGWWVTWPVPSQCGQSVCVTCANPFSVARKNIRRPVPPHTGQACRCSGLSAPQPPQWGQVLRPQTETRLERSLTPSLSPSLCLCLDPAWPPSFPRGGVGVTGVRGERTACG